MCKGQRLIVYVVYETTELQSQVLDFQLPTLHLHHVKIEKPRLRKIRSVQNCPQQIHALHWFSTRQCWTRIGRGFLDFHDIHQQQNGYLHGGVTGTIADIVMGFAAYTLVAQDEQVFTVESKVNYFRPGIGKRVIAKGWVEKAGSRFHFCESEIMTEDENGDKVLIAKSNATMAVREKLPGESWGDIQIC